MISMIGRHKFTSGESEVEKVLDNCSQAGIDVIELSWQKDLPIYTERTASGGFKIPKIVQQRNPRNAGQLMYDVRWVAGEIHFYPDERGNGWAYCAATDKNIDTLAKSLKNNWWRIVDQNWRNKIIEIAMKKGYPTEFAQKDEKDFHVKEDPRKLQDEIARLKAELEKSKKGSSDTKVELPKEQNKSNEKSEPAKVKPLAGKRVSRSARSKYQKTGAVKNAD